MTSLQHCNDKAHGKANQYTCTCAIRKITACVSMSSINEYFKYTLGDGTFSH